MAGSSCKKKGSLYVGTSGWNYPHWKGRFYPEGLNQSGWLAYYGNYFDTVEINLTFYKLPGREVFESWREGTSERFTFVAKASRFFTHMKKLKEPEKNLVRFLENAEGFGEKLDIILFQLPPYWKLNIERLKRLVCYMSRQSSLPKVRSALEVRNSSWLDDEVYAVLEDSNWSLCMADWPGMTVDGPATADFVYVRRHGPGNLYSSCYTEEMLNEDASRFSEWLTEGRDVYVYYNNDAHGYAIENAMRLKEIVAGMAV